MAVIINNVIVGSPCHRKGICPGDTLVSIDGETIDDVLDYRYYAVNKNPVFELITKDGKKRVIKLRKKEDEDPGLEFETYLMDKQHRCRNKCMFCCCICYNWMCRWIHTREFNSNQFSST